MDEAIQNLLTYYFEIAEIEGGIDLDQLDELMRDLKAAHDEETEPHQ